MEEPDMDLNYAIKYIFNNINRLAIHERYTVARILAFRGYDLKQNNNGAYIDIHTVDSTTINDIYLFTRSKII